MTQHLIHEMHVTPGTLAHLVAELHDDQLDKSLQGGWTARQIMAHLRDDESIVMRMRLMRMLVEDNPTFPDFDEQAWMEKRNTSRDERRMLLGDFTLQRQATINVLNRLTDEQWERRGTHAVSGEYTVRSWVEHWIEHDHEHIAQLERAIGDTLEGALTRRAQSRDPREEEWTDAG